MSYFPHAFKPHIENCNLYDVGGHANFVTVHQTHGVPNDALIVQKGIKTLYKNSAIGAIHNSQARFPPPKCYPETRSVILDHIIKWIDERDGDLLSKKMILWLYGPAGAGKSAIAQSICEIFARRQRLAASFFFTRGKGHCGTLNSFIATIAYQLTQSVPGVRNDIGRAVAHDPSIFGLSLDIQIQRLIVGPFLSFLSRPTTLPLQHCFMIVDGLDECDGDDNQSRIIAHIADLVNDYHLPFSFLIASRPEPHIADSFRTDLRLSAITQEFHLDPSEKDIRTFLVSSFDGMRKTHPALLSLNKPWPSQSDLDKLVYRSSGYFIYASTVIKFIGDVYMQPTDSLKLVVSRAPAPFSALDDLYRQILSTTPVSRRSLLISILEVLTAAVDFTTKICSSDLDRLLGLPDGDSRLILRRMHSLLGNIDSEGDAICFIHKSFSDFLDDKDRSGVFHVNENLGHAKIAAGFAKEARAGMIRPRSFGRNKNTFLNDLQTITIDTWKKWNNGTFIHSRSSELEDAITSLEISFCPPPEDVIQKLTGLLDPAYLEELESGKLCPIPIFAREPNPVEPIHESIHAGNINICRRDLGGLTPYYAGDHLEVFLLDKSRCGNFFFDPTVGHAFAFHLCVQHLFYRYPDSHQSDHDAFLYAKKWWTFHLAQCSPDPHTSGDIVNTLIGREPKFADIDGSQRVIGWLKKIRDPPETLIAHWEIYRRALLTLLPSNGDSIAATSTQMQRITILRMIQRAKATRNVMAENQHN